MQRKQRRLSASRLQICVFVFAYAKTRFSHNESQLSLKYGVSKMTESFLLTPVYKKVPENGDYNVFCEDALICVNDVVVPFIFH